MKKWTDLFRQILLVTQLGLTLLTPPLLCMLVCWLLQVKNGIGVWIYIPGLILGLGSSGVTAWKFYRVLTLKEKQQSDKEKKGISFNRHY